MGAPIKFKTVRFMNLFSYGNYWTEIDLSIPQLHLIVGDSGAGKSTVMDAILFALYGKPYKKVVKSSIVNSINNKGTLVEIEFETKGSHFLVRRGIKPVVFEIERDGEILDKDAKALDMQKNLETFILGGLSLGTFMQTAIVGSANFVPFMQLNTAERRKVVEAILSLSIFSKSSDIAKNRIKVTQGIRADTFSDKRVEDSRLEGFRNTYRILLEQKEKSEHSNEDVLAELRDSLEIATAKKNSLLENVKEIKEKLMKTIKDIGPIADVEELTTKGRELGFSVKNIKSKISLWDKGNCPTCGHVLSKEGDVAFDYGAAVNEVESAQETMQMLKKQIDIAKSDKEIIEGLKRDGKGLVSEIEKQDREISHIKNSISTYENSPKSVFDPKAVEEIIENIKDTEDNIKKLVEKLAVDDEHIKYLKLCVELFKDSGIKANIVKVFIPLLNQTINEYLQEFELDVKFEFDEEFNETIKGRGRDDYSYNNLSEGEKRRVDLAILFSWLKIGELKNSANMNLLCADEIMDASLDFASVQNLVKIMQRLINDSGKSIFVISHREELKEAFFDKVLMVKKEGQFSQLEEEE